MILFKKQKNWRCALTKFVLSHEWSEIQLAESYKKLFTFAEQIIKRMPQPVGQVCGPISTGGLGSIEANTKRLRDAIKDLTAKGHIIFDQTIFEEKINQLYTAAGRRDEAPILNEFYLPLFEKKLIQVFHFLPDWESSFGTRWEYGQAMRLNIPINYLP